MGLARKMARRDVIPESVKREWYEKGVRAGVESVRQQVTEQLRKAYDQGFTEAKVKAHISMTVSAVAVLHDKFGYGEVRAKRFADALDDLTESVNQGYVTTTDLMQMLVDDKLSFCSKVEVDDGNGKKYVLDLAKVTK